MSGAELFNHPDISSGMDKSDRFGHQLTDRELIRELQEHNNMNFERNLKLRKEIAKLEAQYDRISKVCVEQRNYIRELEKEIETLIGIVIDYIKGEV